MKTIDIQFESRFDLGDTVYVLVRRQRWVKEDCASCKGTGEMYIKVGSGFTAVKCHMCRCAKQTKRKSILEWVFYGTALVVEFRMRYSEDGGAFGVYSGVGYCGGPEIGVIRVTCSGGEAVPGTLSYSEGHDFRYYASEAEANAEMQRMNDERKQRPNAEMQRMQRPTSQTSDMEVD